MVAGFDAAISGFRTLERASEAKVRHVWGLARGLGVQAVSERAMRARKAERFQKVPGLRGRAIRWLAQ